MTFATKFKVNLAQHFRRKTRRAHARVGETSHKGIWSATTRGKQIGLEKQKFMNSELKTIYQFGRGPVHGLIG